MTKETELPAVKVKALEWKGLVPKAETIVGEYSIGRIGGSWNVWLTKHVGSYDTHIASGETVGFEEALTEAKAAAQADYERRIISALALKDDPGNGGDGEAERLTLLTRPIIGIENRTPLEVFDIMADRIRATLRKGDK